MAEVNLYKQDGTIAGKAELPDALFGVRVNQGLVHEAVTAQLANGRTRLAQTKDRSEVRGGGKKPWKQKGTGRARHGSSRSPIWVGGGITFGPTAFRSFVKKINRKARRGALAMALSDKLAHDQFVLVESFELPEPKTRLLSELRHRLPGAGYSTLIITIADEKQAIQAAKNLPNTQTISAASLNVRDILKYRFVLASPRAIEVMQQTYLA